MGLLRAERGERLTDRPEMAATIVGTATIAAVSALPSMLWAARGPRFLTDDYGHFRRYESLGGLEAAWQWSFVHPARPLLGPFHVLTYGILGDRVYLHALLMAVLNVGLAIGLWTLLRRWLRPDVAFAAALLFAASPNRGSTRMWFATENYLMATLVVVVAATLLYKGRVVAAACSFTAATLLYEGTIGLTVAAVAIWWMTNRHDRSRNAALVLTPVVAAAGFVWLISPKRGDGTGWTIAVQTIGNGLFGSGAWGSSFGVAGAALVVGIVTIGVASTLPGFRWVAERSSAPRLGALVLVTTATPLVAAGAIFGVRGLFDRTNLVPMIGVSITLATAADFFEGRIRTAAIALLFGVTATWLWSAIADVDDYVEAAELGEMVIDRVDQDVPRNDALAIVGPPMPTRTGVAAFVYPSDLDAATGRSSGEAGTTLMPSSPETCHELVQENPSAILYDWKRRAFPSDAEDLCG